MNGYSVTVASNTPAYGGGIYHGGGGASGGITELHSSTIAGNKASYGGGGVYSASTGSVGTVNTIIATNGVTATTTSGIDVIGAIQSKGYNLIG